MGQEDCAQRGMMMFFASCEVAMELADNNFSNISLSAIMLAASIDLWVWGLFFFISRLFFLQESAKHCRSRTYMHDSTQKTIRWLQTPNSAFSCSECCFSLCVNMIYGSTGSICSLFGICTFIPIHGRERLREVYKWHGLEDWFTVCCAWEREREREGRERTSENVHLHYEFWIVSVLLRLSKSACNLQKAL